MSVKDILNLEIHITVNFMANCIATHNPYCSIHEDCNSFAHVIMAIAGQALTGRLRKLSFKHILRQVNN